MEDRYLFIGTIKLYDESIEKEDRIFGFFKTWKELYESIDSCYEEDDIISLNVRAADFSLCGDLGVIFPNSGAEEEELWNVLNKF